MRLSPSLMNEMIRDYTSQYSISSETLSIDEYICNWISINPQLVSLWIPAGASRKPLLHLGGFFPLWRHGAWKQPSLVQGINLNYLFTSIVSISKPVNCDGWFAEPVINLQCFVNIFCVTFFVVVFAKSTAELVHKL